MGLVGSVFFGMCDSVLVLEATTAVVAVVAVVAAAPVAAGFAADVVGTGFEPADLGSVFWARALAGPIEVAPCFPTKVSVGSLVTTCASLVAVLGCSCAVGGLDVGAVVDDGAGITTFVVAACAAGSDVP